MTALPTSSVNDEPGDSTIELANEYACVRIRQVQTGNGIRLEIAPPRHGTAVSYTHLTLPTICSV